MKTPGRKWLEEMADGEDECRSVSVAGDPSRTPWRWLDANHGIGSSNRSWPIVAGILLFLIVTAGSNLCWYARVSGLEATIREQDAYITFAGKAMRDLTSLLNKNDVVFEWQDGKPVQVFDE